MRTLNRRRFIQAGAFAAAGAGVPQFAPIEAAAAQRAADADDCIVRLTGDGLGLTMTQYARLLARLADEKEIAVDNYSLGGIVEEMENAFAGALGKERAIFMPTGTLANHMAVRALASGPSRVIVQEDSHFYQDEGDCAQTLSSLNLILTGGRTGDVHGRRRSAGAR